MPRTVTQPYVALPDLSIEVRYAYGPDSQPRPDVTPGAVEQILIRDSRAFPGTQRSIWMHAPSELPTDEDAAVMVFNDGWWYLDPDGDVRGGVVLDNLAAQRAIPWMIGVFVDPGVRGADTDRPEKNRNVEYDAFDDRYASFVLEEVLPLVAQRYRVSSDPTRRGICGGSSGGNAAVTAAWTRRDGFSRVIGFNSSFAQMPGGNPYPHLLSVERRDALRIFLHAAQRDLNWNEPEENWLAENLRTAAALAEGGYDFRLVVGDGGHSPNHGGVLLPDALRWVWNSDARRD